MEVPVNEVITVRQAAYWLARMASVDGCMTANERRLLKEFALDHHLDPTSLYRMAYAMTGNVQVPEVTPITYSQMLGRRFEEFVVAQCTANPDVRLVSWRSDKIVGTVYPLDNLLPDLFLRYRTENSTHEYFVECKYRSKWGDDGIDLSVQLPRYLKTAKEWNKDFFLVLGVGGTPSDPEEFYIIPHRALSCVSVLMPDRFTAFRCAPTQEAIQARFAKNLGGKR